ncbi:MAG: aminotransferase class V-fold PLP-dependent enzyme [Sandaracinaceae bacterium]|nr:aminotransferase class V-fold PLP-dependent enzyme [Sandaracinaceae bacterium]
MSAPIDPRELAPSYSRFLRPGRILLTGHSHQAWPDAAREGLLESFEDAAAYVDDKWARASEAAGAVQRAVAAAIGAREDEIALGASTHELVARFLSALDLRRRPHLVTTAGEFHSLHRQLSRLAEEGVDVSFVPVEPQGELAARLAAAVRDDTAALLASSVLFETSAIVPDLAHAIAAAQARGAEVLIDAYHAFSIVPFTVGELGRDPIFVTGGGYKYAQWGEGNCWLRVPRETALRPVYTGWFSDFASLADPRDGARRVSYGPRPADRFAGEHVRSREPLPRARGDPLLRGARPRRASPPRAQPPADAAHPRRPRRIPRPHPAARRAAREASSRSRWSAPRTWFARCASGASSRTRAARSCGSVPPRT